MIGPYQKEELASFQTHQWHHWREVRNMAEKFGRWEDVTLDQISISQRPMNCLIKEFGPVESITLGQVAGASESNLLRIHAFGRKSLREVRVIILAFKLFWPHPSSATGPTA